jgi:ABC-type transporter MlaC component
LCGSRALGKIEQYGFEIGKMNMKRVFLRQLVSASVLLLAALVAPSVHAEDEAPDALIKRLSVDILEAIKSDKAIRAGDMAKVIALVDTRIMPNVNFQRMTASAVGPAWRQATPSSKSACRKSSRFCWYAPMPVRWPRLPNKPFP